MNTIGLYYIMEGSAMAFFFIMAVQNLWNRDNRLRMILGGILLYWSVQHILSAFYVHEFFHEARYWSRIVNAIDITSEPTCCFLLVELCKPGWLTWQKVVVHEIPFVILGMMYVLTGYDIWYYVLIALFVAYGTGVFVTIFRLIPPYYNFLHKHYSYDENINLRWIRITLVTFFCMMILYTICGVYDTVIGDIAYIVSSIVCWSWICFCVSRQESVLHELECSRKEAMAISGDGNSYTGNEQLYRVALAENIELRFIQPQMFLDSRLTLGDMAKAVGTNRTYLSRYLNDVLQTTFYNYVNSLRLDYAVRLMEESQHSITTICTMSGFNSYSTFRRVFIARFGVPPQQYKKE